MHVTAPEDLYVPALSDYVRKGETVEVDPDVGESLVEQGWTSARQIAAKKAAKARSANTTSTNTNYTTTTTATDSTSGSVTWTVPDDEDAS